MHKNKHIIQAISEQPLSLLSVRLFKEWAQPIHRLMQ